MYNTELIFMYIQSSSLQNLHTMSQDPEVQAAFKDVQANPANISRYENNPKVKRVLEKLSAKFQGSGGAPGH